MPNNDSLVNTRKLTLNSLEFTRVFFVAVVQNEMPVQRAYSSLALRTVEVALLATQIEQ